MVNAVVALLAFILFAFAIHWLERRAWAIVAEREPSLPSSPQEATVEELVAAEEKQLLAQWDAEFAAHVGQKYGVTAREHMKMPATKSEMDGVKVLKAMGWTIPEPILGRIADREVYERERMRAREAIKAYHEKLQQKQ